MIEKATFAAGCFWGVEEAFKRVPGVIKTLVGYTGGNTSDPDYSTVCRGKTGHVEACEVFFDNEMISYEELLTVFWNIHDPTQKDRQGYDVGTQYRSAIFYHNHEQKRKAESSRKRIEGNLKESVATEIHPAGRFWEAEADHQDHLEINPRGYCHINMAKVDKLIENLKR
ncbi:MAG: peptide-methionine (S)-S-oxide reductase MsrA [Thermoplasmata archaeon]